MDSYQSGVGIHMCHEGCVFGVQELGLGALCRYKFEHDSFPFDLSIIAKYLDIMTQQM